MSAPDTRIAALEAAIEPFAKIGDAYDRPAPHSLLALADEDVARPGPEGLTVGDFRRAAAARRKAP